MIKNATQNGKTALNMSYIGTSFAIADIANTATPTGGVIVPSCIMITTNTPNSIGSKPASITIGKKIGKVSITAGMASSPSWLLGLPGSSLYSRQLFFSLT